MSDSDFKFLVYIRDRLADMINGDQYVDVGTLTWEMNNIIARSGGTKRTDITAHSKWFVEHTPDDARRDD